MKLTQVFSTLSNLAATIGRSLQSVVLLGLRLWWGWSFFVTGRGKLLHLDRTADFFGGLSIPLPKLNALAAGSVECAGGLLLMAGLASRLAAVPLMFTLLVAYATAEREALASIFSDPDKFTGATPFLFLLAVLIVFAFGPGRFSIDRWLESRKFRQLGSPAPASCARPDLIAGRAGR
jgi:putative oxidoreductase